MDRRTFSTAIALSAAGSAPAAWAALPNGERAPDFTLDAALGGKPFRFSLAEALARGPVVLYFFPKAFTSGCTIEAHAFAEATPRFNALGATVIGVSSDDAETIRRFSVEACRSQFAVAGDADGKVIRAYDAKMMLMPNMASRISYVIDRGGRIVYSHQSMSPEGHVANTLKAVEDLAAAKR
ncbi:MAG: peroxiredoxin [Burkholderiaceae bacterium]